MNRPKLIVMFGLSGSGKSTIAKKIAKEKDCVIVSSDEIREEICDGGISDQSKNKEVFKIFHQRIKDNLKAGKNIIADATNLTIKSRRSILENIKNLEVEKYCYIVPKPFELCKEDNVSIQRKYPVPDDVLNKQISKFQIPYLEEGWDGILIYDDSEWEKYKVSNLELLLRTYRFDQKNPHHDLMLDEHCIKVYKSFLRKRCSNSFFAQEFIDPFVMGAKLHDIGKVSCQTFDDNGIAHYYGHSEIGSYIVLSQLEIPTFWEGEHLLNCCFLINYHMLPFGWTTEKACKKWKNRFGEKKYKILIDFHECDITR